jgi:hypothetical protein
MGLFDKLKKGLGVGDLGPSGLSGMLESMHGELESSQTAVVPGAKPTLDTKPIEQFLQEIGKISNPDEFSETEALHPLKRGKKVFFYHASPSPIAPHLMVHPEIEKAIALLSKEGIIKPAELEAAKNPETLLNIITERVTNQFSAESPVRRLLGTSRLRKFLSGESQQDAASVFHAGTLSAARDRMGPAAKAGSNVFLHAYEVDASAVETAIHDDIMLPDIGAQSPAAMRNYDEAIARSIEAEDINLTPLTIGSNVDLRATIATGKKVSLSGQVHPYRNAVEDVGNVSVSIPISAVGSSVRYSGAVDMTPVMHPNIFDEFVRQPIVAARRALSTLGAKVSSAADEIAESAKPVQKVSRRIGVMSRGTLAKVIEAGETAARIMR